MEHASTETLSRPAARPVRAAPQTSPIASDTALIAACRELHKQRRRAIASGKRAAPAFFDLLDTVRAATPKTSAGAAARLALLEPAMPVLPLTGSHPAIDAAVERLRQATETQTAQGYAHTRAEEALQQEQSARLERAEAKANRAYIAAQDATEAARANLLAIKPVTLQEARVKLHAFTMAVALNAVQPIWWREMSFDEARDVIWSNHYGVLEMAMGLEAYAADIDRLTAPPTLSPPTEPIEWLAAYELCDKAEAVFYAACDGSNQAAIDAARDAFVAARDALFLIPAPDGTALAQKIALHPDAPALRTPADLSWHRESGDGPDKAWASLVADAQAVATRERAMTSRPAPNCAAAAMLPAYRAAVAEEDRHDAEALVLGYSEACGRRDALAKAACEATATSVPGALFQLSLANYFLTLANEYDHCDGQEQMFRNGQAALANGVRAISALTGITRREGGWDLDDFSKAVDLPQ